MATTRAQKIKIVEKGLEDLKKSRVAVLTDFTGLTANEMNILRRTIRAMGGVFRVMKKRLLKIIFEKEKIEFDPKKFGGQTGIIFSPKEIAETAGAIYKFSKDKKNLLKILGGFDFKEKKFIEADDVKRIGQLPPREVLLGQLVGMIASPIKKFLFVLNEKAKKVG